MGLGRADDRRRGELAVHPHDPDLGRLDAIHLLSLFTLPTVPLAVVYARRFVFALVIAGLFTLWPGRIITR